MSDAWQEILDSAPDAMLIAGPHGTIGICNRQLEAMFGYERGELLGRSVDVLVPDELVAGHAALRHEYMTDPQQRAMGHGRELNGRRKDGSTFPVEISLSPMEHEVGRIVSVAIRDVTDRHRTQEQFRALLDTAPDAMVIVDSNRRIVLVNRRLEELVGWSREELLGQPVGVLVPERHRDLELWERIVRSAAPGARPLGLGLTLHGLRRDGSEFPADVSVSPLETDAGTLLSAAIRDATERVETERRLRELDVLKDEFLSVVSHELRTPLTAISGFAQLLIDRGGQLDDAMRADMLTRIARNAVEMDRLVGQLLDLSRLDAGQVTVHLAPLTLDEAVRACVDSLTDEVGSRVEVRVPEGLRVLADRHALDRVLSNLLTNAAKFSPDGAPVTVRSDVEPDGTVVVSVIDVGEGIPVDEQEKVFDRFYQLGAGRSARNGTGIGLSIVRRYVELLGGRVWVASAGPGTGSTFSFTLGRG